MERISAIEEFCSLDVAESNRIRCGCASFGGDTKTSHCCRYYILLLQIICTVVIIKMQIIQYKVREFDFTVKRNVKNRKFYSRVHGKWRAFMLYRQWSGGRGSVHVHGCGKFPAEKHTVR